MSSWIFGVFFCNGILTIVASWYFRTPLAFFWTIPGTVVVGDALTTLRWSEVLGALLVTGVLILVLGLSGWVRRFMSVLPMPIVMAMVTGIFLDFGLGLVDAIGAHPAVAAPMAAAFVLLGCRERIAAWIPPVLGALLVGVVAVALTGGLEDRPGTTALLAAPQLQAPEFTLRALTELVVPVAITVLVVQNGQGIAVLRAKGHHPPVNASAIACGVWSIGVAAIGAVPTCLTGPTNALLVASGERRRHYTAALFLGVLSLGVGLFASVFVDLMLAAPTAFVAALGGVAMLRPLQHAFVSGFGSRHTLGALVCFLVTVADVQLLNIGAPFWGIVAGTAVSRLLERHDFEADA
ncbi:benzoate membrane transport protein [Spinactinospora alkalitolerans]|uniref:Benzoate membrane transport protein n=1 Tax=Spinactinospora alkalitolerans TaxID=687207 RepID=A0A852TVE1_9ACTN|nr:benzoate/H(+) symporter BenE family transporter [Spinactinospora alkalitolerans]NYE47908.1 benzoate membrane transport protein [Spinactinospora alkalitolerans]